MTTPIVVSNINELRKALKGNEDFYVTGSAETFIKHYKPLLLGIGISLLLAAIPTNLAGKYRLAAQLAQKGSGFWYLFQCAGIVATFAILMDLAGWDIEEVQCGPFKYKGRRRR